MINRRLIVILANLLALSCLFLLLLQAFNEADVPLHLKSAEKRPVREALKQRINEVKKSISNLIPKNIKKEVFKTISPTDEALHLLRDDVNVSLLCSFPPPNLRGRQSITFDSIPPLTELEGVNNSDAWHRGVYSPPNCLARQRVAIIIPFRDREQHLAAFCHYMHPFLQRQQLEYGIYVIEQNGKLPFNRGLLLNIGFLEALKIQPYDCFIFHDVDLIPEDDHNFYMCHTQPHHLSVAVNTMDYKLPYLSIFGGATAIATDQFRKINGYNNLFWGWGGEDDDISWRVTSNGFQIFRYPKDIARYTMIPHKKAKPNQMRRKLLNNRRSFANKGLSTLKYEVTERKWKTSYTWILVDVKK